MIVEVDFCFYLAEDIRSVDSSAWWITEVRSGTSKNKLKMDVTGNSDSKKQFIFYIKLLKDSSRKIEDSRMWVLTFTNCMRVKQTSMIVTNMVRKKLQLYLRKKWNLNILMIMRMNNFSRISLLLDGILQHL